MPSRSTSSTPTRSSVATTSPRPRPWACACSSSTRSAEIGQGRRGRTRQPACSADWSPPARDRTGRCPASTAARPTRASRSWSPRTSSASTPPASASTSVRSSATRRRGPSRSPRRAGSSPGCASSGLDPWTRSTSGVGSLRDYDESCPRIEAYGAGSSGTCRITFGDRPTADDRRTGTRHRRRRRHRWSALTWSLVIQRRAGARGCSWTSGVFTGLVETLDEAIRYRLRTAARRRRDRPVRAGRPDVRQRRRALRGADGRPAARRSPRATRSSCCRRGSTRAATPASASTASSRCPP